MKQNKKTASAAKTVGRAVPAKPRQHYASSQAAPVLAEKLLHRRRAQWFGVLAAGLLLIQLAYNLQVGGGAQALGYQTDVTHQALLTATNGKRSANGQSSLHLHDRLSEAAQAKANDMVAKNYWNHQAPDGTEAWQFMKESGYDYQSAGENLAYGFKTADAVAEAWMQSPTHRANVLGQYKDIGFGFATGEDYQGDTNTVVVALFGTQATAGQPAQPEFTSANSSNVQPSQHVLGVSVVAAGAAPWGTYASLGLVGAVTAGFVITHIELMRLAWQRARRYAVLHPLVDAIVLAILMVIIIQTAGGFIL